MFLGTAARIRAELGVPVLCSLQGEDIFFDDLSEPYRTRVLDGLRRKAADVDGFIVPSRYYAGHMAERLQIPHARMHHVRLGLNLAGFGERPAADSGRPFCVGYLARVCPEKGLHLLVQAFWLLVQAVGRDALRLRVAGAPGQRDRAYLDGILGQIRAWGIEDLVEYRGELDRNGKSEFLRGLHVLSVPTTYREPKGLYVLEALAHGVPVVQPEHGAFPELLEATGGGLLVEPGSAEALAAGLGRLLDDPRRREELGRRGKRVVHDAFHDRAMGLETLRVYEHYLRRGAA
jgi:glycosyltransferase involved in cell wall biosynthesis